MKQKMVSKRKEEVIQICLEVFVKRGLYETTTRDLCKALELNNGGVYYYFERKDDIVLACADKAALILEENLIYPAFGFINEVEKIEDVIISKSKEMAPIMKFFSQVCSIKKYERKMQPVLDRMIDRHQTYIQRFADILNCEKEDVAPYVYMCVTATTSYLIFGEEVYIRPQMQMIKEIIYSLKERNKCC